MEISSNILTANNQKECHFTLYCCKWAWTTSASTCISFKFMLRVNIFTRKKKNPKIPLSPSFLLPKNLQWLPMRNHSKPHILSSIIWLHSPHSTSYVSPYYSLMLKSPTPPSKLFPTCPLPPSQLQKSSTVLFCSHHIFSTYRNRDLETSEGACYRPLVQL